MKKKLIALIMLLCSAALFAAVDPSTLYGRTFTLDEDGVLNSLVDYKIATDPDTYTSKDRAELIDSLRDSEEGQEYISIVPYVEATFLPGRIVFSVMFPGMRHDDSFAFRCDFDGEGNIHYTIPNGKEAVIGRYDEERDAIIAEDLRLPFLDDAGAITIVDITGVPFELVLQQEG